MSWIWLDSNKYGDYVEAFTTTNTICEAESTKKYNYCVGEFKKSFSFNKNIKSVRLRVSADTFFQLFVNGSLLGIGPAASGGDFLITTTAPKHYANNYTAEVSGNTLEIFSRVRLLPQVLTDYSRGHGGFFCEGTVVFDDDTTEAFSTDKTWLSRRNASFYDFNRYNENQKSDKFSLSEEIADIWNVEDAPIEMLSFNCIKEERIVLLPNEKKDITVEFEKIYGVYPAIKATGKCDIALKTSELKGQKTEDEQLKLTGDGGYMSFKMHSAGMCILECENKEDKAVCINVKFIATWYPVNKEGSFVTSNTDYNRVYEVCKHTLKICRQTLHLDSTTHQELLACTGDYYIETLMNIFCFGDMQLSEFDLKRTADMLVQNGGKMFHTTYSMIWVLMLRDVYMLTGRKETLEYCKNGLNALLNEFDTYFGESGVIETPESFMFVDWTCMDGLSMHHPPKYLGQTVLNAFYYGALNSAAEIFNILGDEKKANELTKKAELFKECFNREFFCEGKNLYKDGKGDKFGGTHHYLPLNFDRVHFSKYPNVLAALFGLCDGEKAKDILKRTVHNNEMQDMQPYFMHWVLCALRKYDLFDEMGFSVLDRWIEVVNECDKGLKEGWIAPEEGYSFDHSHAWGGTPAYQMPAVLTGFEIIEPGLKKIKFTPNLYHLDFADVVIPTEYGDIKISMKKNEKTKITAPEEIEIVLCE